MAASSRASSQKRSSRGKSSDPAPYIVKTTASGNHGGDWQEAEKTEASTQKESRQPPVTITEKCADHPDQCFGASGQRSGTGEIETHGGIHHNPTEGP